MEWPKQNQALNLPAHGKIIKIKAAENNNETKF
jgi:hypothetical protein